jgi:hypothetical protein
MDARTKLTAVEVEALEKLYDHCLSVGCEISWGTSVNNGSFNVKELSVCSRSLFTVSSNGDLYLNFAWLNGSERAEQARERLKELVVQEANLRIPDNYATKWPLYPVSEWGSKVDSLLEALRKLVAEFRGKAV